MGKNLKKEYPPYMGTEPYICFCFASADLNDAAKLLDRLYRRGCRVWYSEDKSVSLSIEQEKHIRMTGADLVIVYLTENLLRDRAMSDMMFLQSSGVPLITVNKGAVTNLAAGLRENTVSINADGLSVVQLEQAVVSSDGFSYDFIGDKPSFRVPAAVRTLAAAVLSLAILAGAFFGLVAFGVIQPETAVPPEVLTELSLDALPDSINDIKENYPVLEKIILPASVITDNVDTEILCQLAEEYTVVIVEG